ncbi:rod shape-determining protein [Christensenellaceae bacterium OttesenSCG-928-M15]|nr:rod shape-determining protein [Christensenellaceae bacterium OttesenSCG-928-M15]
MEQKQSDLKKTQKRGRPKKQQEINGAQEQKNAGKTKSVPIPLQKPRPVGRPPAPNQKQPANMVFSLDIGTRTVIGIVGVWEDEVFHVIDYEQMEHQGRAMIDGQVEDIAQVGLLINEVKRALEGRLRVDLERVAVAAAGRSLKTVRAKAERTIEPRGAADREIVVGLEGEAIETAQAKIGSLVDQPAGGYYCVGYSIVEYRMDGQPVKKLIGHICSTASVELIAAFLPNSVVEGLYASVDMSGLDVVSLTLEPIAAMNVLIPPELRLLNLALVDIGAGTSDIAICRDGVIYSYEMATVAGDEVTEAIIKNYLVDFETAERMKRKLGETRDDADMIEYMNILGLDMSVSRGELYAGVMPAVETLASTVAEKILQCNGAVPAAVFLIGGGSQVGGLTELLGAALQLQTAKIAVGARRALKNVEAEQFPALIGPEFITPLGIAMTSLTQECFHFFGVTINGRKLKLLNFKNMRCIEVLLMAGFRTSAIIGQSGRSLHYTLNGRRRVYKGGMPEHAVLTVNGKSASIETQIHPGDVIEMTPAVGGEEASATISDIIRQRSDEYAAIKKGEVVLDGILVETGIWKFANGKRVDDGYQIHQQDDISLKIVNTLRDICGELGYECNDRVYYYDGVAVEYDIPLLDKMNLSSVIVDAPQEQTEDAPAPDAPFDEAAEAVDGEEDAQTPYEGAPTEEEARRPAKELHIRLNEEPLVLTVSQAKPQWYVMDMLEKAGVNPKNPQGVIRMEINGLSVGFTETLKENDRLDIGWD